MTDKEEEKTIRDRVQKVFEAIMKKLTSAKQADVNLHISYLIKDALRAEGIDHSEEGAACSGDTEEKDRLAGWGLAGEEARREQRSHQEFLDREERSREWREFTP